MRMVLEHQSEHGSQAAAIRSVADKIGCSGEMLRYWVRQAERDLGAGIAQAISAARKRRGRLGLRAGLATDEQKRLRALEREVRELRQANEILHKTSAHFATAAVLVGPGVPCGYVYHAHTQYAEAGFQVVSWDQLGCGRSDRPDDASLWTVPRFVEEVEAVRQQLGWDRFLMLGNSWGGILGMEYCLHHQDRVQAFVIGNIGASMPLIARGFDRVKAALGTETVRMMALREAEGTTEHPEYQAARILLMHRHMCRCETWPKPLVDAIAPESIGTGPFTSMFGPHFYNCSGSLRDWDRMADLSAIRVPTLVTTSEWDYVLPEYARLTYEHLPQSELVIFRESGHLPFWDAADRYHPAVLPFLTRHAQHTP